ncbi:MAG: cyclic nucleotide-binding domain-containing protein [Halobacteriovoraceae bacterium]|jgi:CRP/FNR family transcriptional regulator, cyclic AMP receptor protein|nr:cyclic nucleotide-binding domain-containing protein [Halobacteriovoraceae bacterium]MBT5096126.1 cyclic nucleotide-binding domain-containing protein [Halobacteriovoraceae bacterium]
MSVANLVKGCPLFHEIYENEIVEIIADCVVASYETGDAIIKQGDSGSDISVLLSGNADIQVEKEGLIHKIATISKGDLFGEMVLINETERTASIVANESCDVLIISYDNFYSFYKKNPKVFALMVLNVTRLVTKRLKNSNTVVENLSQKIAELEGKSKAA